MSTLSTLLDEIHEAHGGLKHWRDATAIEADVTYGGPFWAFKGVPDFASTDHVVADIHRQHIRLAQPSGQVIEFDKDTEVVTVTGTDGRPAERLEHPRATFDGYTVESQWSVPQAAYSTWMYLVESFVFTYPGVVAEAIDPWTEDGQSWRGLRATFPATVDTHSPVQRYYFDAKGQLARLDYEPQVNGGAPTAHYQAGPVTAGGLVVADKHEVYTRNPDGTPDRSWMPISLDLSGITVR